jgi:hypothetical protein
MRAGVRALPNGRIPSSRSIAEVRREQSSPEMDIMKKRSARFEEKSLFKFKIIDWAHPPSLLCSTRARLLPSFSSARHSRDTRTYAPCLSPPHPSLYSRIPPL